MTREVMTTNLAATLLGLSGSWIASTAFAQEQRLAPSEAEQGSQTITEVVVTAQRRSELQREVPIAITSINAEQLTQGNIRELTDIVKLTPALRFESVGAFTQPTIRGIGTSVATPGVGANIGIYVDGFYAPNPAAANLQLLNVRNIQVLKGPQGTLFGRNTTGGAILTDSKYRIQGDAGAFGTASVWAYPATAGVSFRAKF